MTHPILLIIFMGGILTAIVTVLAIRSRITRARLLLVVLGWCIILPSVFFIVLVNPWLIDDRFREYRNFYKDIMIGMTRSQVIELTQQRYPNSGLRRMPKKLEDSPTKLSFFMNPEDCQEPNCEGIFLTIDDDRVTSVRYLAD